MRIALFAATALAGTLALAACSQDAPGADNEAAAPDAPQTQDADAADADAGADAGAEDAADVEKADAFTYANYDEVKTTHLHLDLDVNFDDRILEGTATLDFERLVAGADRLVLDTNDLDISSVETHADGEWTDADYTLGEDDPVMGAPLDIALPEEADKARIAYRTSPEAAALQWMTPAQTESGEHPFVYSQNQAINARSMTPAQDTPAVRVTYSARLRTPADLLAIMSAEQDDGPRDGEYDFEMPQPVPVYLLALAVGDIAFEPISERIGVYAEDYIVEAAAAEFEDTPAMEEANIDLYGPYRWGRYDLLVLPPGFPFGGMENPRLSFMTPTLIAGDKSLTNVVAHELAHSWSGNLVTNATWRDAWMNEGVTSYVENRVMEALYGADRAVMEQALARDDLDRAIESAARPELTQLKLPDDLQSPDEGFSQVAYVKGQFFLMFLEERFGRAAFDPFLKGYFDHFAFQSITTEDFRAYLQENLMAAAPEAASQEEVDAWLYEPGLPETAADPVSNAFEAVTERQQAWLNGETAPGEIDTADWTAHEWLHFINTLPASLGREEFAALDDAFDFTGSENAEIANAWFAQAIAGGYEPAMPALEDFLKSTGRGKFIYPLYTALEENGRGAFARRVYEEARPGYHPIAQARIDDILG